MANDIIERIADAIPLERGDRVLFASDVKQMCWAIHYDDMAAQLNRFIDLLKEKIGAKGTLLFPTYNWGFCKGVTFDYKKTRSKTGALSQLALTREDFTRTHHALYSFAVWGKDTRRLYEMNDSNSFVGDTPFDYLYRNGGKMIMLDVTPNRCLTFIHYVEEANGVEYRFLKAFRGKYVDEWAQESERTYTMFVRYLDERNVELNPSDHEWFKSEGVLKEQLIDNIPIGALYFNEAFALIDHDIKHNSARNIIVHPSSNN